MTKKLIKNKDGTHTIKGGFSTTNPDDMELVKSVVRESLNLREKTEKR